MSGSAFLNSILPSLRQVSQLVASSVIMRLCGVYAGQESAPFCMVDATAGNGYDSLFMLSSAKACGVALPLLSFDVQPAALASTEARLRQSKPELESLKAAGGVPLWQGYLLDHADFHSALKPLLPVPLLGLAMFNLGFLPGSDKSVITKAHSTLAALDTVCSLLCPGGLVSVHCYAGHAGGAEECSAVNDFCRALPSSAWSVCSHEFINRDRHREVLLLIERRFS